MYAICNICTILFQNILILVVYKLCCLPFVVIFSYLMFSCSQQYFMLRGFLYASVDKTSYDKTAINYFNHFRTQLSPKREFAAVQSPFTPTVSLKHFAVLRSARRSLERIVRMRRKLLPQTAAAAAIRQRRETGENLSILNHGDLLMMPFAEVNGG